MKQGYQEHTGEVPAEGLVTLRFKTTCVATVTETWMVRVPTGLVEQLRAEPLELLDVLGNLEEHGASIMSVHNDVTDEEDRELVRRPGENTFEVF